MLDGLKQVFSYDSEHYNYFDGYLDSNHRLQIAGNNNFVRKGYESGGLDTLLYFSNSKIEMINFIGKGVDSRSSVVDKFIEAMKNVFPCIVNDSSLIILDRGNHIDVIGEDVVYFTYYIENDTILLNEHLDIGWNNISIKEKFNSCKIVNNTLAKYFKIIINSCNKFEVPLKAIVICSQEDNITKFSDREYIGFCECFDRCGFSYIRDISSEYIFCIMR